MQEDLSSLVVALSKSGDFEEAATRTLSSLMRLTEEAIASSRYKNHGKVLRGMVHLRRSGGYLRLAILEQGAATVQSAGGAVEAPSLVSATAWHSVVQHNCPVFIDAILGTLRPYSPQDTERLEELLPGGFGSQESRQSFLSRQASHVCVIPLRTLGSGIGGMISLEADCPPAMGQDFVWRECVDRLQMVAEIAAPYLTGLPFPPAPQAEVDEYMPVIGVSMASLLPILDVFSQQEESILISGATGAGKSRLARWCHARSSRRTGPFEVLDLISVPEDLQMAELFGWKRGAFTGAVRDSVGSLGRAEGGTLFIDEIDKLSMKAQAGLLRVLEERTYRVLGDGTGDRSADVRFVIGTNVDLREAVRAGRFREDLYYRINVLPLRVPLLDERRDEIPKWAEYMVNRRHREQFPAGHARLSPEAEQQLSNRSWPGNLRQLDNIIRRAYTLAMVEYGATPELLLKEGHILRALEYEEATGETQAPERGSRSLTEAMRAVATAFIEEAKRRGTPLDLGLTEALTGVVLGQAVQELGREEAFRLVGRENLLKNRNHHKVLKRELEKVEALYRELTGSSSPFSGLLPDEEPG
ncbi:sigma 54-interacting transcriptional regulator [Stigmatella sp. ncwal1]|uniref:Sigma 54-interacting transcriptional regulator n=1 Tax=Stigmatella ashevillensis TaxID=2995309 RepID=A0ABT5D5A0_9BACT|nr:sigma 54-interacting transcriptional regulator [Stigmatella ashevillena]MDC0708018.1 sigma 54-interacting transcriptional regulator [Stigmatella ashevillena]